METIKLSFESPRLSCRNSSSCPACMCCELVYVVWTYTSLAATPTSLVGGVGNWMNLLCELALSEVLKVLCIPSVHGNSYERRTVIDNIPTLIARCASAVGLLLGSGREGSSLQVMVEFSLKQCSQVSWCATPARPEG